MMASLERPRTYVPEKRVDHPLGRQPPDDARPGVPGGAAVQAEGPPVADVGPLRGGAGDARVGGRALYRELHGPACRAHQVGGHALIAPAVLGSQVADVEGPVGEDEEVAVDELRGADLGAVAEHPAHAGQGRGAGRAVDVDAEAGRQRDVLRLLLVDDRGQGRYVQADGQAVGARRVARHALVDAPVLEGRLLDAQRPVLVQRDPALHGGHRLPHAPVGEDPGDLRHRGPLGQTLHGDGVAQVDGDILVVGGQDLGLLRRDRQEDHHAVGAVQVFGRTHVLPAVLHLDAPDDERAVLQDLEPLQSGVGGHQSTWNSKDTCHQVRCTPSPFHKDGIKIIS